MSALQIKNGHLLLPAEFAARAFPHEEQIRLVYYPDRHELLMAAKSDIFFEKMHKTQWLVLKERNPQGDKAILIRDILLDHDLDLHDREVLYDLQPTGILCVTL
ncbi:hypothetical protein [Hymenobacter terricola]|uniref:hypothetical protein n=1 Tax=Hymenobacter terricola TaxID=2819236 RepID=UPI001B30A70A|nr:hypothetical protein [Hymenobacter terricola]